MTSRRNFKFPNDLFSDDFFSHQLYFAPKYSDSRSFLAKDFNFNSTTRNYSSRPILVSSYFASHPIPVIVELLGGRMHGPSPPQLLGEPAPQYPLSLRSV